MIDPLSIIKKYYTEGSELYSILVEHSSAVAQRALDIARRNPQEGFDLDFVYEAAMLHDIGIFLTDAPGIHCYGDKPYICHGYLGRELLEKEGLPKHALVCERHTGTGISLQQIIDEKLPLPHRDMIPVSPEEELICFADKFFSKSKPNKEKSVDKIIKYLSKHGIEVVSRFEKWDKKWNN